MTMRAWLRQPTTITGLSAVAAGLAGVGAWYATRDQGLTELAAGGAFAVVNLTVNDNTAAQDTARLVADVLSHTGSPGLVADIRALARDIEVSGAGANRTAT